MVSLKKELQLPNLKLKNRLVMPPMATETSESGGLVSKSLLQYYDEKSIGGYIGLIITEHGFILPEGKASKGQLSVASDDTIDGLKQLVDVIHHNKVKVVAQINHAGGAADHFITGHESMAPTAILKNGERFGDYEMTKYDIKKVVNGFADAAKRVKQSGFDGVEIHSAHGYLLNQFYSPLVNQRNDEYGGKLQNRIRIHLEVIDAVRDVVGNDYPIFLRLGSIDETLGGNTVDDAVQASIAFECAGIDVLDISGGMTGYVRKSRKNEQGYFSDITEAIKKEVTIPIILTGGITEPAAADRILAEGKADMIGVGRAILRDSSWAKRAMGK